MMKKAEEQPFPRLFYFKRICTPSCIFPFSFIRVIINKKFSRCENAGLEDGIMSKVICDVCGTAYAETAAQCPICGSAKASANQTEAGAQQGSQTAAGYTYVREAVFPSPTFASSIRRERLRSGALPRNGSLRRTITRIRPTRVWSLLLWSCCWLFLR